MNENITAIPFIPATLSLPGVMSVFGGKPVQLAITSGVTVLVGPNGAGKTQALRAMHRALCSDGRLTQAGRVVRYLSSGRTSPFEAFRASIDTPQNIRSQPASVGHESHRNQWWEIESAVGDLLALEHRADLRLKLEARLQTLYARSLRLSWGQSGLRLEFRSLVDGASYFANAEASGLLHLISLLAALYNDQISALVIDEPEVSLHPQLQAFFLQEAERCSGDPIADPTKKLIVIATHSTNILPVREIGDLSKVVFFSDRFTPPVKLERTANELKGKRLAGLVSRMSESHKTAFFAQRVLLVEGPSDEIIVAGLAVAIEHSLLGGNTQVVPVTGKGGLPDAIKLFRLASKQVTVVADLDSWIDDNSLVAAFSDSPLGVQAANGVGASSLLVLDNAVRSSLNNMISSSWEEIEALAVQHPYWKDRDIEKSDEGPKRRAVAATLLSHSSSVVSSLSGGAEWLSLRTRLEALLNAMETSGCFILRRGTIETYFQRPPEQHVRKAEAAAQEVDSWQEAPLELEAQYADVVRAMRYAAPAPKIDENYLLREKLGAILGSVFQSMKPEMTDAELSARALSTLGEDASIFKLENISQQNLRRLKVHIASPLFARPTFPFELSEHDNLTAVIQSKLPFA